MQDQQQSCTEQNAQLKSQVEHEQQEKANLLDYVDENVESIIDLKLRQEQEISQHQRLIERITAFIGRPCIFYSILVFVLFWVLYNALAPRLGLLTIDAPPFYWLQGLVGLSALLVSTAVLITQNRQSKFAEQRRHLDLQVSLLVEQKVTMLIELMDELRRDLPSVEHDTNPRIEALKEPVDPKRVLHSLDETWRETTQSGV